VLQLRYARRWQLAGALLLAISFCAAVLPELPFWSQLPKSSFRHADKVLHLLTFVVLSIWFAGQYERSSYWRIGLGLVAFGALIEVIQSALGYRMAEWVDLGADIAGIAIGLFLAGLGLGGWSMNVEKWLVSRYG
jgi:VanZ family protein